jgi:peptidoglycan-N-acetylglucosamine deacetylase
MVSANPRLRVTHPAIVTVSWDDGHPSDLRVAELMAKRRIRGTFYVPASNGKDVLGKPVLNAGELRELGTMGMDIGSHTVTHANMVTCKEPLRELSESKGRLEEAISLPVQSFCYPGGAFNYRTSLLAREAGFKLARTTVAMRTACEFDPFRMPVTLKFHPRSRMIHLGQLAKTANLRGLLNWSFKWGMEVYLEDLVNHMIEYVSQRGGIFHLWGHSWEIDSMNLWQRLDRVLEHLSNRPSVNYVTNYEALELISSSKYSAANVTWKMRC